MEKDPQGKYWVKLFDATLNDKKGKWVHVCVDDYVPCYGRSWVLCCVFFGAPFGWSWGIGDGVVLSFRSAVCSCVTICSRGAIEIWDADQGGPRVHYFGQAPGGIPSVRKSQRRRSSPSRPLPDWQHGCTQKVPHAPPKAGAWSERTRSRCSCARPEGVGKFSFCPSREKLHTVVLEVVGKISDALAHRPRVKLPV